MRYLVILLTILVLPVSAAELPSKAQRTVDNLNKDLNKLELEYQDNVADARADAVKDLEREMQRATRSGNLEEAIAIRDAIDAVRAGEDPNADNSPILEEGDSNSLLAEREVEESVAGWDSIQGHEVEVVANQELELPVRLRNGQSVKVYPHPEDKWSFDPSRAEHASNYKGHDYMVEGNRRNSLLVSIDGKKDVSVSWGMELTGPINKIVLRSNDRKPADNTGTLRVKFVGQE